MDNKIIQDLSENIKMIEESAEQLNALIEKKEAELEQDKQAAVDDIKALVAEQTKDVPDEVWDKLVVLRGALDEKKASIVSFQENEKQVILGQIQKKIEKKKLLSKTLKLYGEIGNSNDIAVEETKEVVKEEKPAYSPIVEPFINPVAIEPVQPEVTNIPVPEIAQEVKDEESFTYAKAA